MFAPALQGTGFVTANDRWERLFRHLKVYIIAFPGLHLNLTEGIPVSRPAEIRSLLAENGQLLGKFRFREALQRQEVSLQEVIYYYCGQYFQALA